MPTASLLIYSSAYPPVPAVLCIQMGKDPKLFFSDLDQDPVHRWEIFLSFYYNKHIVYCRKIKIILNTKKIRRNLKKLLQKLNLIRNFLETWFIINSCDSTTLQLYVTHFCTPAIQQAGVPDPRPIPQLTCPDNLRLIPSSTVEVYRYLEPLPSFPSPRNSWPRGLSHLPQDTCIRAHVAPQTEHHISGRVTLCYITTGYLHQTTVLH